MIKKAPSRASKPKNSKLSKRKPIISAFRLAVSSFKIIREHWRPLLGIISIYLVLNVLFASGLSGLNSGVTDLKANLSNHSLSSALSGFGLLVGSAGSSGSGTGSALQVVLVIIESLVIIWALRNLVAGKIVRVKEAYYRSTGPLIPFVLVLGLIIVQLIPMAVGGNMLSAVATGTTTSSGVADLIFSLIFLALASWSLYMVSSSIFALYIVTLPDMQPRQALRSAKNIVAGRRLAVIRKLIFLPIALFTVMAVIILPFILFAIGLVAPVFYLLEMLSLLFVHTYLYGLYKGLIA